MNIQEYISSGIIQAYVLGLATEEERREFEKLAAISPELQQAREAFELSLEQHAMANGRPAPR
ncbi:MAG: anti-sigma factor, partial [Bacteroidetes bacterium]|nr:anti-sigma factor [Bacteroidota bacterium]